MGHCLAGCQLVAVLWVKCQGRGLFEEFICGLVLRRQCYYHLPWGENHKRMHELNKSSHQEAKKKLIVLVRSTSVIHHLVVHVCVFFHRGRLNHGRHFTFHSSVRNVAITFVTPKVTGSLTDNEHKFAACGTWLQVQHDNLEWFKLLILLWKEILLLQLGTPSWHSGPRLG